MEIDREKDSEIDDLTASMAPASTRADWFSEFLVCKPLKLRVLGEFGVI